MRREAKRWRRRKGIWSGDWRVLDGGLEGRAYLLGKAYCLADTHVWSFVRWLALMEVDLEAYGNVRGWMERVGERPALRKEGVLG